MLTHDRGLHRLCLSGTLILLCCVARTGHAQVRLGEPFGDHMVLPRGVPVVIWGTGCPGGDTVKLSLAGQSVSARSDWEGRWEVRLAPMKAGGPYQMLVQIGGNGRLVPSSAANDHGGAEINDVQIGEVVLLPMTSALTSSSAMSPMPAKGKHPYAEVRVFQRGRGIETTYNSQATRQWIFVAQDTLPPGTAALFEAGRVLHERLHVPVGLVVSTNGPLCSPAQACSSPEQTHAGSTP